MAAQELCDTGGALQAGLPEEGRSSFRLPRSFQHCFQMLSALLSALSAGNPGAAEGFGAAQPGAL